jgi:hypothetical protein
VTGRPLRATLTRRTLRATLTGRPLRAAGSGCDPPDPAAAAGWGSCDGDQVFELVEAALADAWDLEELVDGGEGVGGAVGDDAAGGHLTDTGERVELLGRGGVEVEGRGRGGAGAARGHGEVGRGCGVAGGGDSDLFAVGELAGRG